MSMVSPVNISIAVRPYFTSVREKISAYQSKPKPHLRFGALLCILLQLASPLTILSSLRLCSSTDIMVLLSYHQCDRNVWIHVVMSVIPYVSLHYLISGYLELQYPLSLHSNILQFVTYIAWSEHKWTLLCPWIYENMCFLWYIYAL